MNWICIIRATGWGNTKGTAPRLIGPRWSRIEYLGLLALAYAVPVWLFLRHGFAAWILLPLVSIPYAVLVARRVFRFTTHEELIPMTPQAGQVLLTYSVLFAVGLVRG